MDERKELILNTIINEHIKTGAPVGSSVLVEKYKLNVSSATVRNEMAYLEEKGYIMQPHTSAGRIPTEKAYHYYLTKLPAGNGGQNIQPEFSELKKKKSERDLKDAAKQLAQISGNAVFWAFHRHNVFYTGISNLFQQPEFSQLDIIHNISAIIDRIDEIVDNLFENTDEGEHTLIGADNPFSDNCTTVMAKYRLKDTIGIFGIIGPMRMDYAKNINLVKQIKNYLTG